MYSVQMTIWRGEGHKGYEALSTVLRPLKSRTYEGRRCRLKERSLSDLPDKYSIINISVTLMMNTMGRLFCMCDPWPVKIFERWPHERLSALPNNHKVETDGTESFDVGARREVALHQATYGQRLDFDNVKQMKC